MSKPFNDPSLLTKDRLKRELEKNGIKLPRGEQKKEVYVNLYRENLSPQSERRLGNGEFSSDDDGFNETPQSKAIVKRSGRTIKKVNSKEIVSSEIKSLTDNELKDELETMGHSVGPIVPTTRGLYERKLARLRASPQNINGETVTTLSKSEFSDDYDEEEEEAQEEQHAPEDEFFYKHSRRSGGGGGDTFGSTFTKNFQNSTIQKEVTHDMSVSSSRNVEHSSTVDRKSTNKVHKRKGDKFEERSWSSAASGSDTSKSGSYDQEEEMPALPASVQRALTATQRFTPEREHSQVRERLWKQNTEDVPKNTGQTAKEKPQKTKVQKKHSRKWWIVLVIILMLIVLSCAVVYNLERLPELKQSLPFVTSIKNDTT